ncbi:MAG: Sapep family Mn(2+)-dependent dipeptidase [Clostridiales bacterium]|nr:Sapep family Mn(2+)-dependent dipeptidase [Clostridiales bacterium]
MKEFRDRIMEYQDEYLADLEALIGAESVRDLKTAGEGAPFGKGIRRAFDLFMEIAEKCGLETEDFDGYACHASLGEQKEYVGVLGHLDVVSAEPLEQWNTPPFQLYRDSEDVLYARGVNDDKGPLLAALYAVRILKDMGIPMKRSIRVIAGGAEETTWECMEHYFSQNEQPVMGFSPDGNFPVVNGEKGILKYDLQFPMGASAEGEYRLLKVVCGTLENYVCSSLQVEYEKAGEKQEICREGKVSLSRNPQRGENALWRFTEDFYGKCFVQDGVNRLLCFLKDCLTDDFYGEKLGIFSEDQVMGTTSVCPTGMVLEEGMLHLYLDIRYPRSTSPEQIGEQIQSLSEQYGFCPEAVHQKRLLYVPEESELIQALKSAYTEVTGEEAQVLTKGGASYARTLDCGVAFGASFDGEDTRPHMPNECMAFSSVLRAMEIYCEALWKLTV